MNIDYFIDPDLHQFFKQYVFPGTAGMHEEAILIILANPTYHLPSKQHRKSSNTLRHLFSHSSSRYLNFHLKGYQAIYLHCYAFHFRTRTLPCAVLTVIDRVPIKEWREDKLHAMYTPRNLRLAWHHSRIIIRASNNLVRKKIQEISNLSTHFMNVIY